LAFGFGFGDYYRRYAGYCPVYFDHRYYEAWIDYYYDYFVAYFLSFPCPSEGWVQVFMML
jgi:hypothetical protein